MIEAPPHIRKQRAIANYQQKYGHSLLIETGTFMGDMVEAQKHVFKRILSIELGMELYENAKKRFAGDPNVIIVQGDSGRILSQVLSRITEPAIFWLDGHYSEGITALGDKACPIFEELDAIFAHSTTNHVILIDDARCFGAIEDFPTIEALTDYIAAKNKDYEVTIDDDIIFCVPANLLETTEQTDLDRLKTLGLLVPGGPVRLHLGCGEKLFDGYVNIDYPPDEHNVMQVKADYFANVMQLDFPPDSVDEIRLHHVFEHFSRVTALAMLIKWQLWLKVGGKLLIETPDLMGSSEILVSDFPWNVKMAATRHLAGDQAAGWAYHADHWFPERFKRTLQALGFGEVETEASRWPHEPYLCNVSALGKKTETFSVERLLAAADKLLWESTVSPVERPTYDVWTRQLREVLTGGYCGPGMGQTSHLVSPPVEKTEPEPVAPSPDLIPLAEIHDFNQRARDRWVEAKAKSVPTGARVLDVGAGTCLYQPLFAHCDYKSHDFAQYEGVKHGGGTAYGKIDYVSEILAIPVPDASFDVILCTEVLEHVPEPIKVLEEIARILRPGGRAFVSAPLGSHLHQLPFHFYGGYTPEWYKRFGPAYGLTPIEITPNGGFFKHLAQECARAAYMYSQQTALHGSDAAEIHKLLSDSMPRFFFELDDKCFDEKCTVGYMVEFVKGRESPSAGGEQNAKALTVNGTTPVSAPVSGPSVVVKLMGGLGNQMFQYAVGLALARKDGVSLKLDLRFLLDRTPRPNFALRDYDLGLFALPADCELITEPAQLPKDLTNVPEKHFHFDADVLELPSGIYLDGYWQSPRYFESVAEEIQQTFSSFVTPLNQESQKVAAEISLKNAVCVHVRRTDMVADPVTAAVHGSCGPAYFAEASAFLSNRHPDAHYFVFSDDISWCRSSGMLAGLPHTFVDAVSTGEDLQLMRLCRHFILSNSTYGWWAAYLGSAKDRTVIMPEPWFSNPSMETSDLVPGGWLRMCRQPQPAPAVLADQPEVSVIIPCYNQANYLPEAVASVIAQTFTDWEMIIVNDGSLDASSRVALELIEQYPGRRIQLLEKTNGGLADARNAGIRLARGKYILPLDSDDKIHPQMLEKTLALLKASPKVSIIYTDLVRFGEIRGPHCAGEYDFPRLCHNNQLNYCSLYRREVWEAVGGYNSNMRWGMEDWDFWIGCGERGFFAKRLAEPLFFYRTKKHSMFTVADAHGEELRAQIVQNHPALYDASVRSWAADILASLSQPEALTVSIVVPCYNQAAFLTEAVESVVAQTYTGWELIVVNDGSPDRTSELTQQLQDRFPASRIRLIEMKNGGLANARNEGIRLANGKYILPLDADDKIAPDFLAKTVALLERQPEVGIAYTDWEYFGTATGRRNALEWNVKHLCENENLFTCTALFRKKAWSEVGGYNPNMTKGVEDWDFWVGCAEKGYVGQRIAEALFFYRLKDQSRNTEVQPFVPVMFARIILNHPNLYGSEIVAKAKVIFDAANLPLATPASPGREIFREVSSKLAGKRVLVWADQDSASSASLTEALVQEKAEVQFADSAEIDADVVVFFGVHEDAMVAAMDGLLPFICVLPEGVNLLQKFSDYACEVSPSSLLDSIERALSLTIQELALRKMTALLHSGEVTGLLTDYRKSLEAVVEGGELPEYPAEETAMIAALVSSWQENPDDAVALAQLWELRKSVASFLAGSQDADAGRLLSGSFGTVYRLLLESGLQDEAPTPDEEGVAEHLLVGFDEKGDFSLVRLLAFMLFRRAHRSPAFLALEVLPKWLVKDYLNWAFTVPGALVEHGEAESYAHHLTCWLKELLRRVPQDSTLAVPLAEIHAQVLGSLNLIPVYCSSESTRELMELRAQLLEHSLASAGSDLDGSVTQRTPPATDKRIRIGILNAHFGVQTETFVTLPAFHLDRSQFEIFLFAGAANPGEMESYCRGLADHFTVLPRSLPEQVRLIRETGLDAILVGTNITAVTNGTTLLAAHRLAPVQIVSHCSPMTSGLRNVDGFLSGSLAYLPETSEAEFSEKLIVLDGPPVCLEYTKSPAASSAPADRAQYGVPEGEFIFLNAASCFKIPVELMDAWAQILRAVPNSRLLLMPLNPNWANKFPQVQFERALKASLQRHGVDKSRVILAAAFSSRAEVMELEKIADLYLDTFPFSGSISTVDPLELGIPVVACDGATTRSRCSGAQLCELGLPELVAKDAEEYVRIAVDLAQNAELRTSLSSRIRTAMNASPRFLNPAAYGQQLGRILEGVVRRGWETLSLPGADPDSELSELTPTEILRRARAAFTDQKWTAVEDLCRHLLTRAPETAAAWALLAELSFRTGDLDYASELMDQALELDRENAVFWSILGKVRREQRDSAGALAEFQKAVSLRPNFPEAWLLLAIVQDEAKNAVEAEKAYNQALRFSKDRVETAQIRVNFAGFLREQKRIKDAIKQLRKAVSAMPDSCETMLLLGSFLQEGGDLDEAISTFARVTKKFPKEGKGWLEWGKILLLLGKDAEALEKMRVTADCQPNDPMSLFNLGYALQKNVQRTESLQAYLAAEKAGCDTCDLHTNIGVILKDQQRYMEAAQRFHKGFERNPKSHVAINNLGAVCIDLGLTTEAIECFEHALRLNPTMAAPHNNLGHMLKISGRAREGMSYYLKGLQLDPENKEMMHNYLLSTLYQTEFSPEDVFEEHRKWGIRLAAGIKRFPRRAVGEGHPQGKIRIGYVSPDLCMHPVASFTGPLMGGHDRENFQVYVYSDVQKADDVTRRFRGEVDVWRDISEMQNREAGELMQRDEIDILVDLCGHTARNRLEALAAKPAPIIISYLGYPATTGIPGVDYRITDSVADPLGQTDAWHTEKLLRLDRCAWCFEPPAGSPTVGALPFEKNGFVTFGCFNNLAKLNEPLYDQWVKILRQVPDSRLFLKAKTLIDPGVCQSVRDYFAAQGIPSERLHVYGFEGSPRSHFERYNEVDIALDSFPYHGTTTTCEALWMGVPVITRAGEAHLSRVGVSLLQTVGHPELVAASEEEYVHLAVQLAWDPARLAALRKGLRGQMQASPLLDAAGFMRSYEAALQTLLARPSDLVMA